MAENKKGNQFLGLDANLHLTMAKQKYAKIFLQLFNICKL